MNADLELFDTLQVGVCEVGLGFAHVCKYYLQLYLWTYQAQLGILVQEHFRQIMAIQ
jgi:hypothetical protein